MTAPDLLYLALIVVLIFVDHLVLWPAFVRRSQADPHRARLWLWSVWMIMLWTMVAAGFALWVSESRSWESLKLVALHGWRMWVAVGLVSALAYAQARSIVRIARSKRPRRVKIGNPSIERLVPRTQAEFVWWLGVSLTAGFCEEFVFRGYLIWVFQPLLGVWGAAALSVVLFALAHSYQGATGIISSGIVGVMLTLVVLILGSLWPAIALHALQDTSQGLLAWLAFRQAPGGDDTVAA